MTDQRDLHMVGADDEIQQLRTRISELESRLRARPKDSAEQRWKTLAAALAATTVVLAWPASLTVRRWYRWWTDADLSDGI